MTKLISCNDPDFGLAPYIWKCTGSGKEARVEATMPGAYFKTVVKGTRTIGLLIDGTVNDGCPALSMPVIEYSIDDGPFIAVQLTQTGEVYTFPISQSLDAATPHKLEVYFRASDLCYKRWTSSATHLCIAGILIDDDATIMPYPMRSKRAIGYGDSITEGVGVDGEFTSWQKLEPNNARGAWLPFVCSALDCEYGQLGSGGQGLVKVLELPVLTETWDKYDCETSRLENGLLLPEPDYVFCCMGTNDFGGLNITDAYIEWLTAVRRACPHTQIFCLVPPAGVHRDEIRNVVNNRHQANDRDVHFIDTPSVNAAITDHTGATQMTYDGVHPSIYGNGMYAANIIMEVAKALYKS